MEPNSTPQGRINTRNVIHLMKAAMMVAFLFYTPFAYCQHAVSTLCGTSTQGNPLAGPNGITITPDGTTVLVADYSAHCIKAININSHAVTNFAGSGVAGNGDGSLSTAQFNFPSGIKTSSDGMFVYVADNGNCLIRKIDIANNTVSTIAGVYYAFSYLDNANGLQAMFNQPVDLVIAPGDSVLYISDTENHIIRKLNLLTTAVATIAGVPGSIGSNDGAASTAKFRNPKGLALSANGSLLYIADAGNHKVRVLDLANASVSTLAGSGLPGNDDNASGTSATFNTLQGVALLPNDSLLFVMDSFSNRIRAVNTATTAVTTVAGTTSTAQSHFADNNDGLQAKFYHPVNAVLSLNSDRLFISDQENFRVRTMNTDLVVMSAANGAYLPDYHVFPTPVRENINISVNHALADHPVFTLTNTIGQIIFRGTGDYYSIHGGYELPVIDFPGGIYILKIQSGDHTSCYKIIKSTE